MSNLYSLYRNYSFGKNSCGINFNSPIPTTLQDPSPYTTRCTLRTEDKTRSGWDDDDSHRCSAKCKSRFGIFAIFVERRQPRARQNKVEERERERWSASGGRDITEQALHTHCGHPASLLFHAAKYRVLFTRRFQPRVENSPLVHVGCHVLFILRERTWIRTDDYKSDINLFSSLSFLLSKFSFFLCFFQVESGGGRVLKVRFRFWAAARCRGKSR